MKKKILIIAPAYSLSGYGERSRCFINDIIELNEKSNYDISLCVQNWGNTINKIVYFNESDITIINEIDQSSHYDVIFHITMASDIQTLHNCDRYIIITAGVETDIHPPISILTLKSDIANIMLEIWGSSNHSIDNMMLDYKYPTLVYPETVKIKTDDDIYDDAFDRTIDEVYGLNNPILITGAWMSNQYGHDRKNIPKTIELACKAFKGKDVNIILQTSMGTYSEIENHTIRTLVRNIKNMANSDVRIHIIHGHLTDQQIYKLYNLPNLKWCVTFTHGEGFGRHLAEFMSYGGRILAPNYSGYLDFIKEPDNILVPCELKPVHETNINRYIVKGSKWAFCTDEISIEYLKKIDFDIDRSSENIKTIKKLNDDSKITLFKFLLTI